MNENLTEEKIRAWAEKHSKKLLAAFGVLSVLVGHFVSPESLAKIQAIIDAISKVCQ